MYIKVDLQDGESTKDFPIVDFFNSIYKENYIWNISYIYFIAKQNLFDNTNDSVDNIENEITRSKPNGLFVSWERLIFILQSSFQIYDITISVFKEKMEIMKFEIFDCSSIEITADDNDILNKFNRAIEKMKT